MWVCRWGKLKCIVIGSHSEAIQSDRYITNHQPTKSLRQIVLGIPTEALHSFVCCWVRLQRHRVMLSTLTKRVGVLRAVNALQRNSHHNSSFLLSKANSKLFLLHKMVGLKLPPDVLMAFYMGAIRSPLEFAAPAFGHFWAKREQRQPQPTNILSGNVWATIFPYFLDPKSGPTKAFYTQKRNQNDVQTAFGRLDVILVPFLLVKHLSRARFGIQQIRKNRRPDVIRQNI